MVDKIELSASPFIFTGATWGPCRAVLPPQVLVRAQQPAANLVLQLCLMLPPGFMALVALFLDAGELNTAPIPKDKQVRFLRSCRSALLLLRAHLAFAAA